MTLYVLSSEKQFIYFMVGNGLYFVTLFPLSSTIKVFSISLKYFTRTPKKSYKSNRIKTA